MGNFAAVLVPGFTGVTPNAVNDAGVIAGFCSDDTGVWNGFLYEASHGVSIYNPPGRSETILTGINDSGQVIGNFGDENFQRFSFVRKSDGTVVELSRPEAILAGINDAGVSVGFYHGNTESYAFLWDGDYRYVNYPGPGRTFLNGISDTGLLAGAYFDRDQGAYFGFVATPVPEPGTLTLLVLAVGLLAVAKIAALRRQWRPRVRESFTVLLLTGLLSTAGAAHADEVTYWNSVLLQAIRTSSTPPPRASRGMAMMHTAAFDAVNSLGNQYLPYLRSYSVTPDASGEAAVAQASRDVLVSLFPSQQATFDTALTARLAAIPAGPRS